MDMIFDFKKNHHKLGKGGEAEVYILDGRNDLAAKIYHKREKVPIEKLNHMISNPPDSSQSHHELAWPQGFLTDKQGNKLGYYMSRVNSVKPVHQLFNPKARKKAFPDFNLSNLYHVAINLAIIFQRVHAKGYVIGDVNESNILIAENALVSLIDTDSFQVKCPSGTTYRCPVGKPEYTPPELQKKSFANVDRSPEQDLFGLAVIIYQLILHGSHPFRGSDQPNELGERIGQGLFPFGKKGKGIPPKVNYHSLPLELQQSFEKCFIDGHRNPSKRPTAAEWVLLLKRASSELIQCSQNPDHYYHGKDCPHCVAEAQNQFCQIPLPPKKPGKPNPTNQPRTQANTKMSGRFNFYSPSSGQSQPQRTAQTLKLDILYSIITLLFIFMGFQGTKLLKDMRLHLEMAHLAWASLGFGIIILSQIFFDGAVSLDRRASFKFFFYYYLARFIYSIVNMIIGNRSNDSFIRHYWLLLGIASVAFCIYLLANLYKKKLWVTGIILLLTSAFIFPKFFANPKDYLGWQSSWKSIQASIPDTTRVADNITHVTLKKNESTKTSDQKIETGGLQDQIIEKYSGLQPENLSDFEPENPKQKLQNLITIGDLEAIKKHMGQEDLEWNYIDESGMPLFQYVIIYGSENLLKEILLTDRTIEPDKQNSYGETALMLAVTQGDLQKVQHILFHLRPDIKIKNNDGKSALDLAEGGKNLHSWKERKERRPYSKILRLFKKYQKGKL